MKSNQQIFSALYGKNVDTATQTSRYQKLKERFFQDFETSCDFFSSPGRVEICGNHTDHNHGKVLVGAISVDTLAAASKSSDKVVIRSEGYPEISFGVDDIELIESEAGTSAAMVKGVLKGFKDRGYKIGGFVACTASDVFKGAGVSSSASFELLVSEILNIYYNEGKVSKVEKAIISQFAENVYFKKPCGLLDQMGISLGGISTIDFEYPEKPSMKTLFMELSGYQIYIVNTGGDHSNLTYAYAGIKDDMRDVAAYFGKCYLREVDETLFYSSFAPLQKKVSGRAILRATHFFEENHRVERAVTAVENKDIPSFLSCINESGESSYKLLQNCYAEGDTSQRIPFALSVAERLIEGGAVRVHGGGFAGTILCFVKTEQSERFEKEMNNIFGKENVFNISIRESGAELVEIEI